MFNTETRIIISAIDNATGAIQGVVRAVDWLGGSITKASIQFDAIVLAAQTAFSALKTAFNEIAGAVDGFNLAVAQSAAMITGMMAEDTKPLAERYREARQYAEQLQLALEQIDKETLLTSRDLSSMTMEMQKQGILLDVTNQKQVEAFKSLANAVAVVSQGYPNKEVQIRQEIRSLLSGQVRATDALSGMLKAQVSDLEEQIALHKEQGDLVEWLGEQLQGFAAASGDIEATWEAVKTSMETTWQQVLRGAFAEPFRDVVGLLRQMSAWFSEHREQIQEGLGRAWNVIRSVVVSLWELFKELSPLLQPLLIGLKLIAERLEWIAINILPRIVQAIRVAVEMAKELFAWLRPGGEGAADVLIGRETAEGGAAPAPVMPEVKAPAMKKPPSEELQKKLEEWKKLKDSLLAILEKTEAETEWEKKIAEINARYRQVIDDPKWKGVPGVRAFMDQWRTSMIAAEEKEFEKRSYEEAVKIAADVEKRLADQAVAALRELRETAEETYRDETEMAERRYRRAEISERELAEWQMAAALERIESEEQYQRALEIRYRRGEISWEKYQQLVRQSDTELKKLKDTLADLADRSADLAKGFEGGWQFGWDVYARDLSDMYKQGVDSAQRTARGMEQSFRTLFFDVMTANFKKFGDLLLSFFRNILAAIAAEIADFLAKNLMRGLMGLAGGGGGGLGSFFGLFGGGGALSGLFGGGGLFNWQPFAVNPALVLHGGGIVGFNRPRIAMVAAREFEGARRFHLGSDEVPAVLQKGEIVLPKGTGPGGVTINVFNIKANDAKSFSDMCRRNPQALIGPVTRGLMDNRTRNRWNELLR